MAIAGTISVSDQVAEQVLSSIVPERRKGVGSAIERLQRFIDRGTLSVDSIRGKVILDWECGLGDFAVAFLALGARSVVGTDVWLNQAAAQRHFGGLNSIEFRKGGIRPLISGGTVLESQFDLVFANTVTEHLANLAEDLLFLNVAVGMGGSIFLNHQNYYGPSGHHDFAFVDDVGGGSVGVKSIACWESPEKCTASQDFRKTLAKERPWMWSRELDEQLNPAACSACPYKKRSKPWAHLLHQDEFVDVYRIANFMTGKPKSSLNKITIFQLRQMVVEAGFTIRADYRSYCKNEPPAELLGAPYFFTKEDLRTWMFQISAIKTRDMRDIYPYLTNRS